jgi:hypothetical protein
MGYMVELQEKEKRETLVRNSTLWERTDEEKEVGRGEGDERLSSYDGERLRSSQKNGIVPSLGASDSVKPRSDAKPNMC